MRKLVGAETLLKTLWPDEADRPSKRWLDEYKKRRAIPFIKLGARVWYDVEQVAEAIAIRHTIQARRPQ